MEHESDEKNCFSYAGARGADDFVPLFTYLQEHPPQQLMPPGEVIIYSSVGIAIAGQVVEDVTGTAFADYVQQHIFESLRMNNSSFIQPPDYPTTNAATGYRYRNGEYISYTGTYYSLVAPAGDFVSTGLDMASFMLAHLENGRLYYTWVSITALGFILFLRYWNLLGWPK